MPDMDNFKEAATFGLDTPQKTIASRAAPTSTGA